MYIRIQEKWILLQHDRKIRTLVGAKEIIGMQIKSRDLFIFFHHYGIIRVFRDVPTNQTLAIDG